MVRQILSKILVLQPFFCNFICYYNSISGQFWGQSITGNPLFIRFIAAFSQMANICEILKGHDNSIANKNFIWFRVCLRICF